MTDAAAATAPKGPHADSGYIQGLPLKVRNVTLLCILATTPIAAAIAITDLAFLNGRVRDFMSMEPRQIAYWTAVLTIPHIVASLITFIDREYVAQYKKPLLKGVAVAVGLGIVLPLALGPVALLIALAFYTMYHNLQQQYGISLMMMRQPPTFDYQVWRWMTILPGGAVYTILMASYMPIIANNWELLITLIGAALAIATVFGIRFFLTIRKNPAHTKIGLIYFLMNMAMLYVGFGLIVTGYGLLATLVPRIIHDLTAFWIYMVHDQNRNADVVRNPVYALPKKLGLQPVVICMPLAIGVSYILMEVLGGITAVSAFVVALNFMHYYMEGHMWKRGALHRQHVPFV